MSDTKKLTPARPIAVLLLALTALFVALGCGGDDGGLEETSTADEDRTSTPTRTATREEQTETATEEPTEEETETATEEETETATEGPEETRTPPSTEDVGDFLLIYEPLTDPDLTELQERVEEDGEFEVAIDALNENIALPQDVPIHFQECGEANAYWSFDEQRVLFCMELFDFFREEFQALRDTEQEVFDAMMDSMEFVLIHELGHGMVDIYALPITGREEDAVDDLASLAIINSLENGNEVILNAADAFFIIGKQQEEAGDLQYWHEHSFGLQRYYSILCLAYGKDPETLQDLVDEEKLPVERAVRCESEYEQKYRAWTTLLGPYFKTELPDAG